MKDFIIFLFATILVCSCSSSRQMTSRLPADLNMELSKENIPINAWLITVKNDKSADENFSKCKSYLLSKKYVMEKEESGSGLILTSKTFDNFNVRLNIKCFADSTTVTSEWAPGEEKDLFSSRGNKTNVPVDWRPATWTNQVDRSSVSFISEFMVARVLDGKLSFVTSF